MLLETPLRSSARTGQRLAYLAGRRALGATTARISDDRVVRLGETDLALRALFAVLARMVRVCRPALRADVQFEVGTHDGVREWTLRAADDGVTARAGRLDAPDLTLRLQLSDLLDLARGRTTGVALAARDRLDIDGDLVAALALMRAAEGAAPA